jgi:hypothetical protein
MTLAPAPLVAHAGSNGQQLEIGSDYGTPNQCYDASAWYTLTVTGTNQYGGLGQIIWSSYTIYLHTNEGAAEQVTDIPGYWWVGAITIQVQLYPNTYCAFQATVPKSQVSNWYLVDLV